MNRRERRAVARQVVTSNTARDFAHEQGIPLGEAKRRLRSHVASHSLRGERPKDGGRLRRAVRELKQA